MKEKPNRKEELIRLDDLSPNPNNPNTHPADQLERLVSSLVNYGWTLSILVDASNTIIAGEGRWLAARLVRERGQVIRDWPDTDIAPVIRRADLSEAEARAYGLLDNKIQEYSAWDDARLIRELEALAAADFDLGLTAFDEKEIERLLAADSGGVPTTTPTGDSQTGEPPAGQGSEEPPKDRYKEQYGIIVICNDEAHQQEVYNALIDAGYVCKVVTT